MAGRKSFDVTRALDDATRVFWECGFDRTSVHLLTGATGLGRGSLYGTFGDKEHLFLQALEHYASTYAGRHLRRLAAHPRDPEAAIGSFLDSVLHQMADPSTPAGCLITRSASDLSSLGKEGRAAVRELLGQQQLSVRAALEPSGLPEPDLQRLAQFIVAVNQSLSLLSAAGSALPELESIADTARSVVADQLALLR